MSFKDILAAYGLFRLLGDVSGGPSKSGNDGSCGCGCLCAVIVAIGIIISRIS
ncbi:MAG: hypothetical protein MR051_05005 [Lentisphaeria bacterium]|nr:hypothetical protein [Lentisphaeria bacterium]